MASPFNSETTADQIAEACADQIRDKVVLTTGVSPGGLGASFVETIAKHHPKLLVLAGRDAAKTEKTAQAIAAASPGVQTRTLLLDLSSQAQIREAAKQVNAYAESIDVLVNNAAVMASPYTTTVDGLESQFGTNHIGHFLFTNLIIDKILAAGPGARIINITSDGHRLSPVRFDDLDFRVHPPPNPLIPHPPLTLSPLARRNLQQMARLRPSQNRQHALHHLPRRKAQPKRHPII